MSILVVGGDRIENIIQKLSENGFSDIHHISGRRPAELGKSADLSVPTKEHYLPLLYIAGLQEESDEVNFIYKGIQHSSMSMTSIKIG